jgi:exopolyphosphatase/guanosine-5'-triphosphate,3'-diphosphate pyrophosphatase
VIDIGGGSTEIVIGEGHEPQLLESLKLGCVSMSQRFFADEKLSAGRLKRARLAARVEIEPVQTAFLQRGWASVVGSSGTVRAIGDCLHERDPQTSGVTAAGLERLLADMARAGNCRELRLESLSDERRPVFAGGVVILGELFDALGIEQMRMADGALRDGLLHDMIGRLTDEDPRERTVSSMLGRFHVDVAQAARVEATALEFLGQVAGSWDLDDAQAELALKWAARLHEIGLDVAHSGYHRHGAYLLENADLPGFAREEQLLLARLVGAHRRKLLLAGVEDLIPPWDRRALYLMVLLRLAVLLHRGRSTTALPPIELTARGRTLELRFPARWLKDHPLSIEDLQLEIELLRAQGVRLRVYSGKRAAAA